MIESKVNVKCVKCGDAEGTYPSGMCKSPRCHCYCVFPSAGKETAVVEFDAEDIAFISGYGGPDPAPSTPAGETAAEAAAREIDEYYDDLVGFNIRVMGAEEVAAIISKHFPPSIPAAEVEQDWCDHCSGDLNGVKHILCEKCYRQFDSDEWNRATAHLSPEEKALYPRHANDPARADAAVEPERAVGKRWYVGTMNDGYFVIDQKPQPAPVDYVCDMDHDVNVIAACGSKKELAELLVAEHNARIAVRVTPATAAGDVREAARALIDKVTAELKCELSQRLSNKLADAIAALITEQRAAKESGEK